MNDILRQIENLRDQIIYLNDLFSRCSPNEARTLLCRLNATKDALKAFKEAHAPEMLIHPTNNYKFAPLTRMDDFTEEFETTLIK